MNVFQNDGSGYLAIQNTRPQTIGYGLVDSPLLQLAWIAEKVHEWTDLPVDRDQLLTTVSLYWFTGPAPPPRTPSTSRRIPPTGARHRPCRRASRLRRGRDGAQTGPRPGRRALDRVPARKHFPAMEAPTQLAADLQAFFGRLQDRGAEPAWSHLATLARLIRRPAQGVGPEK